MATLRLVRAEPQAAALAEPEPRLPTGPLLEATHLVTHWLSTEFDSPDDATADLAQQFADRLRHRDEEINRLAQLLWETLRRNRP